MRERIPLTVLTGFLGAGKTTLLNRLLRDEAMRGAAVVVNEFGDVGIDHLLVEATGDDVVLLSSGCLCCTIRGELVDTLTDLAARRDAGTLPPFPRLVLETTGLADPAPILKTLIAHPAVSSRYRLDGVVAVVDAAAGAPALLRHPEGLRQAAVADRIVVTKRDIADAASWPALAALLDDINPAAPRLDAAGAGAADILDGLGFEPGKRGAAVETWLGAEDHGPDHPPGHHPHGHHHHDVNRHDGRIRAFTLTADAPLPLARLDLFLDRLRERHGDSLLRLKAIVATAENPARPMVLHGVRHVLHAAAHLPAWPSRDRRSRFVLILEDADAAAIADLFDAVRDEPRLDRPDAAAIADNPLRI